ARAMATAQLGFLAWYQGDLIATKAALREILAVQHLLGDFGTIGETDRRRARQDAYNREHGITPQTIVKTIDAVMSSVYERDYLTPTLVRDPRDRFRTQAELDAHLARLQEQMRAAAANLDFEKAAHLRDEIKQLRNPELGDARPARRA
ncbi:MAG: UvrB/UvrC motif-containing protein, partial [Vicinamibacterales bacterium]